MPSMKGGFSASRKKMSEEKEYIIGVDDAGKGPVIGPMVIAGVIFDKERDVILRKMGVKDSKMLFPKERERLAKEIEKMSRGFEIVKISPQEIDNAVNTPGFNLNRLEAMKMGQIVNALVKNINADESTKITVYVDCPSPNIFAWRNILLKYVERKNLNFKVEHKCDVNHAECSAASIIAKVTRDAEIEKIKKQIGDNFGSGYSHDPITIEWLKENIKKHRDSGIFRESWQTFKNHDHEKKQKSLGEY